MDDALLIFEKDLAASDDSQAAIQALEALARSTVGAKLFTVMIVDREAQLARRAYSSHPADYPTSGTKPIEPNAWYRHVVENGELFVANSLTDIAEVFPDYALIDALGCGAVINLPVKNDGTVVATVNLLDEAGRYPQSVAEMCKEQLEVPAHRVLAALA